MLLFVECVFNYETLLSQIFVYDFITHLLLSFKGLMSVLCLLTEMHR
jgi:hypothetical protein